MRIARNICLTVACEDDCTDASQLSVFSLQACIQSRARSLLSRSWRCISCIYSSTVAHKVWLHARFHVSKRAAPIHLICVLALQLTIVPDVLLRRQVLLHCVCGHNSKVCDASADSEWRFRWEWTKLQLVTHIPCIISDAETVLTNANKPTVLIHSTVHAYNL